MIQDCQIVEIDFALLHTRWIDRPLMHNFSKSIKLAYLSNKEVKGTNKGYRYYQRPKSEIFRALQQKGH